MLFLINSYFLYDDVYDLYDFSFCLMFIIILFMSNSYWMYTWQHSFLYDTYFKNSNLQVQFIRNKNKTYRHVHWQTHSKLKAHRESVPLRVSTAGIILFRTVHLVIILPRHVRYNKVSIHVSKSEPQPLRLCLNFANVISTKL